MWKLFSSLQEDPHKTKSAIARQKKLVRNIWNGKRYNDFGVERLVRLFLVVMPFTDQIYMSLLICFYHILCCLVVIVTLGYFGFVCISV